MIRRWLMTGLGSGYAPVVPGTFGSAAAAAIALGVWAACRSVDAGPWAMNAAYGVLILLAGMGCVRWGLWAGDYFAGRATNGPHRVLIARLLVALAGIVGVRWGGRAAAYFAGRLEKRGDPGPVVLDEFAGQWMALIALPMGTLRQTLTVLGVQFVLFRLLDVLKPPPARQLERLPGGWGILCDDLAAGLYANLLGQVALRCLLGPCDVPA